MKSVYYVFLARLKEFYRDRASLLWNFAFPFLLIFGFYFIYASDAKPLYKIGIVGKNFQSKFKDLKYSQFIFYNSKSEAIDKVRRHKLDLLLQENSDNIFYWINPSSSKSYFLEKILAAEVSKPLLKKEIQGRRISYLEWVFPGILCMNLMFSCLWGVGYVIVKYRQDGYLKRLNATPLTAIKFLTGQLLARLVVSFVVASIVLFGGMALIQTKVYGSYLNLLVLLLFGVMSLVSVGLIVATRTTSKEFADGILNFVSWPMMFFSEVWFSLESSSKEVLFFSNLMPLTHLVQGVRKVMIEGLGFQSIYPHLLYMGAFTLFFMTLSAFMFKWSEE